MGADVSPLFADTSYFLALLNPRDALHAAAVAASGATGRRVVTTMWVVQELADGLCSPSHRGAFLKAFAAIEADAGTTLLPLDPAPWRRGLELYTRRPDKAWSLTDCISFVVMTDLGLGEALTGDHHFEQAGFRALLREA
jgi:predicted nucleic acid-binding protein